MKKRILWLAALTLIILRPVDAQTLNVRRERLPNGLTVLALEDHLVPTAAYYTLFKAGSRNERPGITGISHLFEHMMFNGSARFRPKMLDQLIEAGGGSASAFTTTDTTEYMEEVSSGTLDTVIRIEADRMRALKLDRENLEQERGIVKEERRVWVDNSVRGSLDEVLTYSAFVAHPYRWPVIGFMQDLNAIRLEDARAYYRTYYAPNNAVVSVVGDFSAGDLFARIRRHYAAIPRQPAPRPVVNAEPEQQGERRITFHRAAELPAVAIAFQGVSFRHGDDPALNVLDQILSHGESSRLYRTLVYEQQIATEAESSNDSRLHPGLFSFYAQAQQGHTAGECEQAIDAILEEIRKDGVTDRELQKAKNSLRVQYLDQFKTNLSRAGLLAQFEAHWGDWRRLHDYLPRHDRVTRADVQRVARKYLTHRRRTVVTLVPEPAHGEKS